MIDTVTEPRCLVRKHKRPVISCPQIEELVSLMEAAELDDEGILMECLAIVKSMQRGEIDIVYKPEPCTMIGVYIDSHGHAHSTQNRPPIPSA